ncbi:hypothetical protein JCM10450v2_003734 [Rhodotorula kratochvilovae]
MPHKRAKRSVRLDRSSTRGLDNPPTAADSLLPIQTLAAEGTEGQSAEAEGEKRSNKRRKKGGQGVDLAGASKSAFRVINAVKLREDFHAQKKRKLDEANKGKNPNQQKKPTAIAPLPYESLGSFNRRVEQELRGTVRSAIQAAGSTAQKRKDRKGKAKKTDDDGDEEEEDEANVKRGRDGKPLLKRAKPTPEEAHDPFAKKAKPSAAADDDDEGGGRNRTGRTEFATADNRRRIDDVVKAPPTLADPARRGLMQKVLGPGGAAACGVTSEGAGVPRLAGAEAPVGSSRLPINPAMKKLLDAERERAVKMYRELKEKREKERSG